MSNSTWILLRGLMREQRHWGNFPAQLAQALPDATIVTPDLPGNGQQYRIDSATRVAQTVEFCRQDLRSRGLAPPYRLLALSLGGMVAVVWASRYPHEVQSCVLINTSMRPYSPFYRRLRWHNYPALLRQLLLGNQASQEALILRLTSERYSDDNGGNPELVAQWLDWQQQYPVSRRNALRQLLSAARFRAPTSRPPMPLLVLAGARDRLVDHRCSLHLARAWQADIAVHPDGGHDLPLDQGQWVLRQIGQWVRDR